MSRSRDPEAPPAGCICGGLLAALGIFGLAFFFIIRDERERKRANETYLKEVQERYVAQNTPPAIVTVATVNTGNGAPSLEATSHYVVETIPTIGTLAEAQIPLVKWLAAHPDLQLVEVIALPRTDHGWAGVNGFIIVAEPRTR
jgi:hypothetical protein